MKKVLTIAAIAGLVAVPSIAFAAHKTGATDDNQSTSVNAENEQENDTQDKQNTGSTNQHEAENEQEANDQADTSTAAQGAVQGTTTEAEARDIAQAAMPGKTIDKVHTENEHGATIFSFRFTDKSRVDVDSNGNVTRLRDRTTEKGNSAIIKNDSSKKED